MVKLISRKREIAYKIWIKDIHGGQFFKKAGWEPNYVEVAGKKISRVNILATVVSKFISEDGNYGTITLDDGSETIRARTFGPDVFKIKDLKIGAIVRLIGRVKEYSGEIYISPEIVREVEDPNWIIVHKLELGQPLTGEPEPDKLKPSLPEEVAEEELKEKDQSIQAKILQIIKELDDSSGAEINEVIARSGLEVEEARAILVGLLNSGEVYEPRKGKLKILE